jgi:hypothetical protein
MCSNYLVIIDLSGQHIGGILHADQPHEASAAAVLAAPSGACTLSWHL